MSDEKTVVVGVDGSDAATAAIHWAAHHAASVCVPLTLVHAVAALDLYLGEAMVMNSRAIREERDERGRQVLRDARQLVRRDHPGVQVTMSMPEGTVADVVTRASETASLVVLGSRRASAVHDLVVGSDAIRITRRSHAPGLLHREGDATAPTHDPVVVGVDQSDNSARAAERALQMACDLGTDLVVARFWQPPIGVASAVGVIDWRGLEDSESATLAQWVDRHLTDRHGVSVTTVSTMCTAAAGLRALSSTAQMLVVGSRGRGAIAGLLLGSVSQNMIHHADCSVLVVP